MLQTYQETASSDKDLLEVRKRLLKACLSVAIPALLMEIHVSSATNIITVIKKRYNIQLSPGTLYPVLHSLVRDEKIKRIPHRTRDLYLLTSKGKETIVALQENVGNLNKLLTHLIKNSYTKRTTINQPEGQQSVEGRKDGSLH